MNVVSRLKTTKELVRYLLEKYPHYRDQDDKLVAHVWNSQLFGLGKDSKTISAYDFLIVYSEGKITSADDITRNRRMLQSQYPELRGIKWLENHHKDLETRKEMHSL